MEKQEAMLIDETIEGLPLTEESLPQKEEIPQKQKDKDEKKDDMCDDDNQNKKKEEVPQKIEEKTEEGKLFFLVEDQEEQLTSSGLLPKKALVMGTGKKYDTVLNILQTHKGVKMVEENATQPEDMESSDNEDESTSGYIIRVVPLKDEEKNEDSSAA